MQSLLHNTDYKGNQPPKRIDPTNGYRFTQELPWLIVPISDYLEAYGVSKKTSKRGKSEYSSAGRKSALDALDTLAKRQLVHAYDRNSYGSGLTKAVRVEAVGPLVKSENKNGLLTIIPSPVLVDEILTRFIWKPKDLYSSKGIGRDRTKALFIEYLCYLFTVNQQRIKNRNVYLVKREMETIANALRMGSLLDARQVSRVRKRLNALYEYAKKIGYLSDFKVDAPGAKSEKLDILHLNAVKFRAMKKVHLQVSQGLPATVALSASNGSNDINLDKENQEDS